MKTEAGAVTNSFVSTTLKKPPEPSECNNASTESTDSLAMNTLGSLNSPVVSTPESRLRI
jgi:hypothetical protein